MPSIVALILCTFFVLLLLRLDHKYYPDFSLALWLPTLWLLFATGKRLGTWFGISGSTMEEGSPIDRVVLLLIFFLGLLVIKKRNINIVQGLKQNKTVLIFLLFMFISISWSEIPLISLKRYIKNLIPIVMAFVIYSEQHPRKALECIFRRIAYIHIPFSYVLIQYYSYFGRRYGRWTGEVTWVGTTDQKDSLAFLCILTIFYFSWKIFKRWKGFDRSVSRFEIYIDIFIIVLSIWLFMGPRHSFTYSATATSALAIAYIAFIGLIWFKKHEINISSNLLTCIIISIIILGTLTAFLGHFPIFSPPDFLNRDDTLTGRSTIWAFLVPYAIENPILGHGYGGFWTSDMRNSGYYPGHNGYLETILGTGFIGLILLSTFFVANCRVLHKLMDVDFVWGTFWFCILLMTVTRNITESVIMDFSTYMPGILLFIYIPISLELSKRNVQKIGSE